MADIAELGFRADTKQLEHAEKVLNTLPPAAQRAERATDRFNNEIDRTKGAASRFVSGVGRMTGAVSGALMGALAGAAAAFALAFGATALIHRIEATAEALDQVSKAARAVGSSVAEMQALAAAGDLAGVGVEALSASTRRMNRVLGDAIAKGKGTEGVFARLQVSAKELAALPIDQRFAKIADQMKKLGFSTSDATAALALLGDRGGNLIGLLGEGGDQIRKAAADVEKFHLAITDLQGLQIEEMNDNFTRLGYSIQGAFNQFVAFIAPAFAAIFLGIANAIAFVVENIGMVAPIAQIAGAALLTAFGPAIVSAVIGLINVIAIGLVDAIVAVGVAIAANPLGALAIAIVTIITAIWTFRDTIKTVFGVDVEAIVKGTANAIVRFFATAILDLQFIWNNFPVIVGAAVTSAVNAVIDGINFMIGKAVEGINALISKVAQLPGLGILFGASLDPALGQVGKLNDEYSALLGTATELRNQEALKIAGTDYFAGVAGSATEVSTATDAAAGSVAGLGSALDGVSGPAAKASSVLKGVKSAAEDAAKSAAELGKTVSGALSDTFKSFFKDIMHGKDALTSITDALGSLADKAMDFVLDASLNAIFGAITGGMGGMTGGSGGMSSWFKGFADGGTPGGLHSYRNQVVDTPTVFPFASGIGMMGEAGAEAIMPLKRGADGKLGVTASNDNRSADAGIKLEVNIINNASNDVQASAKIENGQLIVMIDKINAENITNSGSKSHKAIAQTFGLRSATKGR